ncbi:hypothetical protein A2643_01600 [Candidatus Nomurabacteria bacterium RIFCSPHIGHO2_01_FULL_39_220]|uniref:Uncharacterized protein n=1 Tax=Candidatus Nomurabacteria bacterium RIFCSPLOWO2_02_FULL_40_67 TaxID=1801787 RepID=A0A1F6Y5A1_9BACT|nr:MAG: hypothetical protein UU01_C0011G0016 [Parcubacteria group bacterium GW2011_GWA2_40_37]KKS12091.1 MAG: hypothetical protein UU66_C0002G0019 [Parcubacteria group bacterium GW2011_GWB1_41_5]KKS73056.1 MAG: hypothetical protein UV43_C0010G0014 [Parcubacteria group bacterium GW2011_GWF2_42_7]OGI61685.1 MAG: hypothetical protein A2W12_02335 [Candidatus Nomurabacteria bacterium RBG_16_40_11]OGI69948.1 MAG: hypothetical protein A2643_01600 [Candidatus Nomurabacteria bacterium RIFCSPHIGHO2_01_FU
MFALIYKIWWMIAVLPFLIFLEINDKVADFLKRKNIYSRWDWYHGLLVVLIILLVILWLKGYHW